MRLTVVGSGDAFGAGGRLQACFHVQIADRAFLIDCGVTSIMGLSRNDLDPERVDTILVSHLHGDHFGGLVWWLIHAVYVTRRTAPLTVAGPPGIQARFLTVAEALYPGSTTAPRQFDLRFVELTAGRMTSLQGIDVWPHLASHPAGAPSHMLRIQAGGRTIAFSGDTEWVEDIIPCQDKADLFICECQAFRTPIRYHMSWNDLEAQRHRLTARQVLVTHMGPEMLANAAACLAPPFTAAHDGMVMEIG